MQSFIFINHEGDSMVMEAYTYSEALAFLSQQVIELEDWKLTTVLV